MMPDYGENIFGIARGRVCITRAVGDGGTLVIFALYYQDRYAEFNGAFCLI